MYNGRAILEMTRLSRRACLFSSPYKYAYSSIICDLDKIVLGPRERPEINCRSIIYPFNILYYLGYKPQLEYMDGTCTIRESPEEAIERLVKRYEELIDINDEIRKKIRDFINNRQDNGVFKQKISSFIGFLIWKVNTVSDK
jgi:hypothetical protein